MSPPCLDRGSVTEFDPSGRSTLHFGNWGCAKLRCLPPCIADAFMGNIMMFPRPRFQAGLSRTQLQRRQDGLKIVFDSIPPDGGVLLFPDVA